MTIRHNNTEHRNPNRYIFPLAFFFSLFAFRFQARAQAHTPEPVKDSAAAQQTRDSLAQQKDLVDVLEQLFHKKLTDTTQQKDKSYFLSILPAVGYSLSTQLTAVLSSNVSFYAGNSKSVKLSAVSATVNYSVTHMLNIPVVSNIWLHNNEVNIQGDYRYYKYPTYTYGLGGHTTQADADQTDYSYIRIYQYFFRQIAPNTLLGIGYNLDNHWDITDEGKKDGPATYRKYGYKPQTVSSGVALSFLYDKRTNQNNSQGGFYTNIKLRPNFTFMGSDDNWQSAFADVRKYFSLPGRAHNVLALWTFAWFTNGKVPYLDLPSTGWDTYVNSGRGYAQGRFRGKNMLYFESEYRFRLVKNGLFGGVVFLNTQSVSDWPSNQFQTFYPGGGLGLRIKANKHSNTNFAIDYGWGVGSHGFSFNVGEIF